MELTWVRLNQKAWRYKDYDLISPRKPTNLCIGLIESRQSIGKVLEQSAIET